MLSRGGIFRQLKVMFVGDSLTVGVGDTLTLATGGYKTQLIAGINARIKTQALYVGSQFNNGRMCGASGMTAGEIAVNPYLIVQVPQYTPDVIFLHIGTNDCTQRNTTGTPTLTKSRADVTKVLDNIRNNAPNCIVFIARIIDNQTAHNEVVEFNETAIDIDVPLRADYAAGLVKIVDIYNAVGLYSTDTFADGSHLNSAGYTLEANAWQTAFNLVF